MVSTMTAPFDLPPAPSARRTTKSGMQGGCGGVPGGASGKRSMSGFSIDTRTLRWLPNHLRRVSRCTKV